MQEAGGNKYLQIQKSGNAHNLFRFQMGDGYSAYSDAQSRVIEQFDINVHTENPPYIMVNFAMAKNGTSITACMGIKENQDGIRQPIHLKTSPDILNTDPRLDYDVNTWYTFRIIYNLKNHTYSVYYKQRGAADSTWALFAKDFSFRTSVDTLKYHQFGSNEGRAYTMDVDEFSSYEVKDEIEFEQDSNYPNEVVSSANNTISATWTTVYDTVTRNQTYDVYLDDNENPTASGLSSASYTFTSVPAGCHKVTVKAYEDENEITSISKYIVVKGPAVTYNSTTVNQVVDYLAASQPNTLGAWKYYMGKTGTTTSATSTTDAIANTAFGTNTFWGQDASNNLVVYNPGVVADKGGPLVYQDVTLVKNKYYNYTISVKGVNATPVSVKFDVKVNGTNVNTGGLTSITPGTVSSNTVTSNDFQAPGTSAKMKYILSSLNGNAIKIAPIELTEIQPVAVTNMNAVGTNGGANITWNKGANTSDYQTFKVAYTRKGGSRVVVGDTISNATTSYNLPLPAGEYTIEVISTINGHEVSVSKSNVVVTTMITAGADILSVEGFQIKVNNSFIADTVAYRAICKAPKIGSTITVDDVDYEVAGYGTVYTIDTNWTGYHKNNTLNPTYTILDYGRSSTLDGLTVYGPAISYNNSYGYTVGYVSTAAGVLQGFNPSDASHDYYVQTMQGMDDKMAYTIHVRSFIITTDNKFIYSGTAITSVAEIADYLYKTSASNNYTAHRYLYNAILSRQNLTRDWIVENGGNEGLSTNNNVFYRTTELDYGWGENLYTPGESVIVTLGTLEDLNE